MTIWGDNCRPPWEYAFHIEGMRTREERAAYLATVPEHLRDMVKAQVISDLETINAWARRCAKGYPVDRVPAVVVAAAEHLGFNLGEYATGVTR